MGQDNKYVDGLVSIIMPAYNAEQNICEAIDSVLSQTYTNWELIVVNDCSTDNTLGVLKNKYSADERIKIYTLEENSGVANARNFGFTKAKGRYLAFLDSDDKWLDFKLKLQLDYMISEEIYFVVSAYEVIDDKGYELNKTFVPKKKIAYIDQLKGSQVGCLTVMLDRKTTGTFSMPNIGHEDYVTWNALIKKYGEASGLQMSTGYYRSGGNSLSSNKIKAARWQWEIYRKVESLNLFISFYYFLNYFLRGVFKYHRVGEKHDNCANFNDKKRA